ncbi:MULTISPECIES: squalene synthase HpnC [unclassified Massilia]|uniref:squalene synthase HpnC n=1 Tax=unclassified Massilia TaxID=2609279 RepID=UPI00177EF6D9|nr:MULTISPECIES: squalene synthase HpnC [unclassified Massilia]MBD8531852.1 squalene synthase HpnC [Massilia sp. CFBP 13647]MBD8675297.1 squalene synthase HpnC [Massilia sp. CFBP 13721]
MAVDHYENFPVASILLPRRLVPAVEAIYAFARGADDVADEGDAGADERLRGLAEYEAALDDIGAGRTPVRPMFARLAAVVAQHGLSLQPLRNLLSAFRQDVVTTRYADYSMLLDYCRRSADPVGRLMLALYQVDGDANLRDADAICSALQLINFWQDVGIDIAKGRIYLPQDDLVRFGVGEADIAAHADTPAWRALMAFEVERARALMLSGAPLATRLPGRIGWELRLVIQGGLRILERIEAAGYDVYRRRPKLGKRDYLVMGWRALRM